MLNNKLHVPESRRIVEFDVGIHHEVTHGFNFIINRPFNSLDYLFVILSENLALLLLLLHFLHLCQPILIYLVVIATILNSYNIDQIMFIFVFDPLKLLLVILIINFYVFQLLNFILVIRYRTLVLFLSCIMVLDHSLKLLLELIDLFLLSFGLFFLQRSLLILLHLYV